MKLRLVMTDSVEYLGLLACWTGECDSTVDTLLSFWSARELVGEACTVFSFLKSIHVTLSNLPDYCQIIVLNY